MTSVRRRRSLPISAVRRACVNSLKRSALWYDEPVKKIIPFQVFFFPVFLICLAGALGVAPAGDSNSIEPGLKNRSDILFFGGFESSPWAQAWGMEWGPEPAAHAILAEGTQALDGHSLRVLYPQGTYGGEQGGFLFRTDFSRLGIAPQESLYLRYYLRFDSGFDFVKGGKLPGLAGRGGQHRGPQAQREGRLERPYHVAAGRQDRTVRLPSRPAHGIRRGFRLGLRGLPAFSNPASGIAWRPTCR